MRRKLPPNLQGAKKQVKTGWSRLRHAAIDSIIQTSRDRTESRAKALHVRCPLLFYVAAIVGADVAAADGVQQELEMDPVGGHAHLANLARIAEFSGGSHCLEQQIVRLFVLGTRCLPARAQTARSCRSRNNIARRRAI